MKGTKRLLFAVAFFILSLSVSESLRAQNQKPTSVVQTPPPDVTATPAKPAVDDTAQKNVRLLQAQFLSLKVQQFERRDQYNQEMAELQKQETDIGQQLETAITNAAKACDPAKYVLNRGTLVCDPKPAPPAPAPADKK